MGDNRGAMVSVSFFVSEKMNVMNGLMAHFFKLEAENSRLSPKKLRRHCPEVQRNLTRSRSRHLAIKTSGHTTNIWLLSTERVRGMHEASSG
jgi:hypothetical protein